MLNVGDNISVEIKRLGINGEGIGYYNRLAIFIPGGIPGERCDVEITSVSEKMAYAKIIDIKNVSKDRCEPKCKYYNRCGGCNTMHINYNKMGDFKRDRVIESITRYTDLNPRSFEVKKTVLMQNPYNYRYKASLPVRKFNDNATVGLYSVDGKEVIYIDGCMNQADQINNINKKILALMDKLNVVPYIEKYKRGEVKYIVTRVSHFNKEAQVTFVIGEKTPKIKELAKEVIKIDSVVSVFESFADGEGDSLIFGSDIKLLEGKKTILENIGKYKFELLPTAFFQLNPIQTEVLYEHVLKACKLSFKERVLDAYCGVGTIGIYLAHNASEVIGIEYNKEAVENANNNAQLNKIKNAKFLQGDVVELLPHMIKDGEAFDVIVADPPRVGLGSELCEAILESGAKRFIYVSCNPATLAKDLNILTKKYNVNSIEPFDMFPNTSHVETVALLTLNPSVKK